MNGIKNFLELVNDNWATIVACVALAYTIFSKARSTWEDWHFMSEEEKAEEIKAQIEAAKKIIGEQILKLVSKAEIEWQSDTCKLGPVRRAEVIEKIYAQYPVLLYAADQDEILAYIDKLIDQALVIVRETIRKETGVKD